MKLSFFSQLPPTFEIYEKLWLEEKLWKSYYKVNKALMFPSKEILIINNITFCTLQLYTKYC